ncbi:MAG: hypothetical protein IID51_14575 [Proteobacteria bacterium]|nr:hypothetical protein [Pseudomonadota bacterium]
MLEPHETETAFPKELLDQIAKTIGLTNPAKRRWLQYHLRDMPDDAASYRLRRAIREPGKLAKEFNTFETACQRVLNLLDADATNDGLDFQCRPDDHLHALLLWEFGADVIPDDPGRAVEDGSAKTLFEKHVGSVVRLKHAAANARVDVERKVRSGQGGRRHEGDWALEEIIRLLLQLYEEVTDRQPGTSVDPNTGKAGGPVVRFLQLCLPRLGWHFSASAIRAHVRRVTQKDQ